MSTALWTIARFTLVELLRSRWLWLCLAGLAGVGVVASFTGALALTERHELMLSAIAPFSRLCCIAIVMVLGTVSVVREIQERTWLLMLAAPLSRPVWLSGKWLGLALAAALTALLFTIPVFAMQPGTAALAWGLSLMMESVLVASLVVAAALAFCQVPASLLASISFYFAARIIGVVKLLNDRAPLENSAAQSLSNGIIDGLALLLPRLDVFTLTHWLSNSGHSQALSTAGLLQISFQAVLYSAIALSAASIDLTRKDLA